MSDNETASDALPDGAATGRPDPSKDAASSKAGGYHMGGVDTVISVEEVTRQVSAIAETVTVAQLDGLVAGEEPYLSINDLRAGYGQMEIQIGRAHV